MVLYGVGGHAKSVLDCLNSNQLKLIGVFDDNPANTLFMDIEVKAYSPNQYRDQPLILSIGDNAVRSRLAEEVRHDFGKVNHSTAYTADNSQIGLGSVVMANATIQASANIGNHCIINSAAIVEHDCQIGDFVHVGPGAVVCGNVLIRNGAMIGANATILPGIKIGSWAVIGAGGVVTSDVADGECVASVPARKLKT